MERQPHLTGVQRADGHGEVGADVEGLRSCSVNPPQVNNDVDWGLMARVIWNVFNSSQSPWTSTPFDPFQQALDVNGGDPKSHGDVKDAESGTAGHGNGGSQDHVIDVVVAPQDAADPKNSCAVCTEPLKWVAIGRCGHRAVCRKCMVRIRFFHRDKRCRICGTHCPKVIVVSGRDDTSIDVLLSTLPRFALREGRVGKLWYHRLTAAYYEDEKEYNAARVACQGILSPFFSPWVRTYSAYNILTYLNRYTVELFVLVIHPAGF